MSIGGDAIKGIASAANQSGKGGSSYGRDDYNRLDSMPGLENWGQGGGNAGGGNVGGIQTPPAPQEEQSFGRLPWQEAWEQSRDNAQQQSMIFDDPFWWDQ